MLNTVEFQEFRKIPRLSREIVITEKIDGTNGVIYIGEQGEFLVGIRSRWIDEHTDNHNFWHWATDNKQELLKLGSGFHYGEWWGSGIQRGYGLPKGEKRFSLFNTQRWCLFNEEPKLISIDSKTKVKKWQERAPACCSIVPILYTGDWFNSVDGDSEYAPVWELMKLRLHGSKASPGFMSPEGIVIYHKAGNVLFKKTIEKDEEHKGQI